MVPKGKNTAEPGHVELLAVAALERYQASWDQMIQGRLNRDACKKVDVEFDEIRRLMHAMPRLAAEATELTMRHAQLLRALLKHAELQQRQAEVDALRRKHREVVEALRQKCCAFQESIDEHRALPKQRSRRPFLGE